MESVTGVSSVKELAKYMARNRMPYKMNKIIPGENPKYNLICQFHHGPRMYFSDCDEVDHITVVVNRNASCMHYVDAISTVKKWWLTKD